MTSLILISLGILLIWISSEKLERYSILSAKRLRISPFLIGSTVIAFGTSSPEILTSFFAALENRGAMVVGNVVGSNIANLSLVFGSTILILGLKKKKISFEEVRKSNLFILLISSIAVVAIVYINPFNLVSSYFLLFLLVLTISFWFFNHKNNYEETTEIVEKSFVFLKLTASLIVLTIAAWLITRGALVLLYDLGLGELFVGYTVLAIGTSLPEISASLALALKGRHEALAGTLIGSNIFNSLFVLSIPGLLNFNSKMSVGWNSSEWNILMVILIFITIMFCTYLLFSRKKETTINKIYGILFLSIYFLSLGIAFK